jgi:hypothetical protein
VTVVDVFLSPKKYFTAANSVVLAGNSHYNVATFNFLSPVECKLLTKKILVRDGNYERAFINKT